jgi:hypothetical protein
VSEQDDSKQLGKTPSRWDVFIAHASEDKDELVRPLAHALVKRGLSVWYDEFELKVGDSLRAKIDEGLANSHFGIVVFSPSFFGKSWPPNELSALFALEDGGRRRILPIWHRISKEEVAAQSPLLVDRRAARSPQPIEELVDELLVSMEIAPSGTAGAVPPLKELSLSPPPAEVELKLLPSGSKLVEALVGIHESTFDVNDIPDDHQRVEAAEALDEIRELAEIWEELPLADRERAKSRSSELLLGLMEDELLAQVGHYERRLSDGEGSETPWRGIVVRVAPAAVIAEPQRAEKATQPETSGADQENLDQLLALLPRSSVRMIEDADFSGPWLDRIKTPLRFLVNEYDEVEHGFADEQLEEARQRLLQAAHYFLYQEAMNGFANNYDPRMRDAGFTPAEAEGEAEREELIERRHRVLSSAAKDFLDAYDEFVEQAWRHGYRLDAIGGDRHPLVKAFDAELGL